MILPQAEEMCPEAKCHALPFTQVQVARYSVLPRDGNVPGDIKPCPGASQAAGDCHAKQH